MPKKTETPILNRLAEVNDGRSAITGEIQARATSEDSGKLLS